MNDAEIAQAAEWAKHETEALARAVCPYSGMALIARDYDDGPPVPGGSVLSCGPCDCFGYDRDEVPAYKNPADFGTNP